MKKKNFVLIILLIPCILLAIDYINFRIEKVENIYHYTFKNKLYKSMENKKVFRMGDITNFKWDKMHVIPPYTPKDNFDEIVKIKWTSANTYFEYLYEKTYFGKYPLDDDSLHKLIFTFS